MSVRQLTAETTQNFDALQAQASRIMGVLTGAGYELVAPAAIQPAGVFLDVIGEALRSRTYVFTDPAGAELCLRPDLTVPVCRLHLERDPKAVRSGRYCYNGAAFRYQPANAGPAHPREFRQAGFEQIGGFAGQSPEMADAASLALVLDAIEASGMARRRLAIRVGDLGLARAVMAAVDMPRRWRQRLAGLFWRADAFRAELARLSTTPGSNAAHLPRDLMDALAATHDTPTAAADAVAIVLGHLDERRLETFGARPVEDVAASLAALARDAVARPLAPEATAAIERYIAIGGTLAGLPEALRALAAEMNLDIAGAIASTEQRNAALERAGIDPGGVAYSGEFGRALAYYTGFVFEIGLPEAPRTSPIAGGGRYDRLMATCGAPADVPAVGAAIHTERLLVALAGGGA